jgi:hypothetical protein
MTDRQMIEECRCMSRTMTSRLDAGHDRLAQIAAAGSDDPSAGRHSVGAQPERCDDHHPPPGVAEAELRPGIRLSFLY